MSLRRPLATLFLLLAANAVPAATQATASAAIDASAPVAAATPAAPAEPAQAAVDSTEAETAAGAGSAVPTPLDPMDERLAFGSYGIAVGDVKDTEITAARVGLVDGALHLLAVQAKGYIHNPLVPEQAMVLPLASIKAVGLRKSGFNRQVHVDLGDRVAVFSLSGGMFVDRKGTQALYDALVAAGVPTFAPKRFVYHTYHDPVIINVNL